MQVLDNLIANAVKFSHRNQRVHVNASLRRQTWRVDVADSGIGIPPDEAGQLFSRFVRASNARTAGLPGIGLGLSIVKILVEMHGGHVEVHSILGLGSTFSVYLPAHHAGPCVKGRVLVIEDDRDIALGIRTVLSRSGFDVASSADGKEGLRAFHDARPDLVVLDIGLPSLDGWAVLERIRDLSDVPSSS